MKRSSFLLSALGCVVLGGVFPLDIVPPHAQPEPCPDPQPEPGISWEHFSFDYFLPTQMGYTLPTQIEIENILKVPSAHLGPREGFGTSPMGEFIVGHHEAETAHKPFRELWAKHCAGGPIGRWSYPSVRST